MVFNPSYDHDASQVSHVLLLVMLSMLFYNNEPITPKTFICSTRLLSLSTRLSILLLVSL